MRNLCGTKFQLGGVLSAECAQVWPKIFLRIQPLNQMATRAPFFQKETVPKLNLLFSWLTELGDICKKVRIGELRGDVLRDLVEILVRPAIARHAGVREIALRIAKPDDEPVWIDFSADFGQLRPNIAADQLGFAGA